MNDTASSAGDKVVLRAMTDADIPTAHALSREAGWPHRAEDWAFLFRVGHGVVACDGEDAVCGTAMWWPFGEAAGSVGMVIVPPKLQHRGIGRRLMQALAGQAESRSLRLTATAAGYRLYESGGFEAVGAIHQHQGTAMMPGERPSFEAGTVRPMRAEDHAAVVALDRAAFGADRARVFDQLTGVADGLVCEREEGIVGFSFCRLFGRGRAIGPVVAADDAMAVALIHPHVVAQAGEFLRIDTAAAEGPFVDFLDASGLVRVGGGTVMVKGAAFSPSGSARTYALVNQALG
ncbi:GNAT family N-acetyltransferase [Chelatococcus sp. GCM10030263]|uniref:GNAT family N-acetyltransferase n=1 Tax=Chelatococcus sp. GCM10030263 TaxID=3273387 RepID=UPI00361AA161